MVHRPWEISFNVAEGPKGIIFNMQYWAVSKAKQKRWVDKNGRKSEHIRLIRHKQEKFLIVNSGLDWITTLDKSLNRGN